MDGRTDESNKEQKESDERKGEEEGKNSERRTPWYWHKNLKTSLLIHSADQQSRSLGRDVVHPSVRTFQNRAKQSIFRAKKMFTTDETVGLAEWIIDDAVWYYILLEIKKMFDYTKT